MSWPEFNDQVFAELIENVCEGKSRLEEAERTDLVPYLQSRLTPAQNRELQESAPRLSRCRADDSRGSLTNLAARRSWPCVFKNYSAGPRRRGWPEGGCRCCCTCSAQTTAPCRSPTT